MKQKQLHTIFVASLLSMALIFPALILSACGGGGGSSDAAEGPVVRLSGRANYPSDLMTVSGPAANSEFQVLDLAREADEQDVARGQTNADGEFSVVVGQSRALVVLVNGEVRVSGLISTDLGIEEGEFNKDFDGVTDVACEAGVTAITEGSVLPEEFSSMRIANLEAAARIIVDEGRVDFSDPTSVTAAADEVRELTNDGANPVVVM